MDTSYEHQYAIDRSLLKRTIVASVTKPFPEREISQKIRGHGTDP